MRYKSPFEAFFYAYCKKYCFKTIQIDKKLTIFVLYFAYMFGISILKAGLDRKSYTQKSRPIRVIHNALLSNGFYLWSIGGSNP